MSIDRDERTGPPADDPLEHLDDHERPAELRRTRRLTSPLTWVLLCAVIAVGAFAVGAKVGNDHASDAATAGTTGAAAAAGAAGRSTGGFGGGRGGFGAARGASGTGAAGTVGQVQLVDGSNLYVSTFDGGVVKVTTSPSTTLTALEPATLADIKAGSTVVVQGTTSADGDVAATSISQGGARGGATAGAAAGVSPARSGPSGAGSSAGG
ncbi:MAG: hypothetical protein JST64_15410 [Actinobacteria bacterium]|nr:hypothetical protein [Actinomycetota bacterium]